MTDSRSWHDRDFFIAGAGKNHHVMSARSENSRLLTCISVAKKLVVIHPTNVLVGLPMRMKN